MKLHNWTTPCTEDEDIVCPGRYDNGASCKCQVYCKICGKNFRDTYSTIFCDGPAEDQRKKPA